MNFEEAFDPERIKSATDIDPDKLNDHFTRLPSDLAYYNEVYSEALKVLLTAKRLLDIGEADLRVKLKGQLAGTKVTVSDLDAMVLTHNDYRKLQEDVDSAEYLKSRAAGVVDAVRAKREMLVSLGAQLRAEMAAQGMNIRTGIAELEKKVFNQTP